MAQGFLHLNEVFECEVVGLVAEGFMDLGFGVQGLWA